MWPPAPGWWVLALLLLAAAAYGIWLLIRAWRERQPIRDALALYRRVHERYSQDLLDVQQYLNESNEILKRLLVRSLHHQNIAPLHGDAWLAALDQIDGSDQFVSGPGHYLGDERFAPQLPDKNIVPELHACLLHLLKAVRP